MFSSQITTRFESERFASLGLCLCVPDALSWPAQQRVRVREAETSPGSPGEPNSSSRGQGAPGTAQITSGRRRPAQPPGLSLGSRRSEPAARRRRRLGRGGETGREGPVP